MVVEEAQDGRNHNPRQAKADMVHNDGHREVQPVTGDHSHRLANQVGCEQRWVLLSVQHPGLPNYVA